MTTNLVKIKSALISVYHKTGLDRIVEELHAKGVIIYSTGGTYSFLEEKGIPAEKIEDLTGYPSILGGRVKTLYPFEDTLKSGASAEDIIEKIDIGGISLIRAAAKNFEHVLVISSQNQYPVLEDIIMNHNGSSSIELRKKMAAASFAISSKYDSLIGDYLSDGQYVTPLRYGENPHQKAEFLGNLDEAFEKIQGKELSFNNLVDIDAALELVKEFETPAFCIIKHTNPCGVATSTDILNAWMKALAGDTVSAFGGILACNRAIDSLAAVEIDKIFFEVIIAPDFSEEAITILTRKKNRNILKLKPFSSPARLEKTVLNGILVQDRDGHTELVEDLKFVTDSKPSQNQISDMLFANKIVKHAKSNTIVLAKDNQLIGIGVGQTSRIDALKQAIDKAKQFNFETKGAVMASDAFFPFPDCVQTAYEAGIEAVIQPGGSVRDQESIDYCNAHSMPMVITGYRHFKH